MPPIKTPVGVRPRTLDDRVGVLLGGGHLTRDLLLLLAGDLLGAIEVHLTSAPSAGLEQTFASNKPTTIAPTCVPNDCECRCKSPREHMERELRRALGQTEADVASWCITAFFLLRPHPDRKGREVDDGREFSKRVVTRYLYLQPELAAAAESAINPGTDAEQIRRTRKAADRHRETGARVPAQEDKREAARQLRAEGHTHEQVAAALDASVSSVKGWAR